jgi:hypothetical protein
MKGFEDKGDMNFFQVGSGNLPDLSEKLRRKGGEVRRKKDTAKGTGHGRHDSP